MNSFQLDTSLGLLKRVHSGDDQAWLDFSTRCAQMLHQWARWNGLQAADADDLTHEALLVVLKKVRDFKHSGRGSLRAWLRAIAWRCLRAAQAQHHDLARPEILEKFRRTEYQIADLEEQFDQLQQLDLLRECMRVVQQRVRPQAWEAFRLLAVDGIPGPVAAAQLQMQPEAVHAAKNRIQKLISAEIRRRRNSVPKVD
ncbi:MAG: RNA polymerase sigma factor [Planctomycetota bacterium]